MKQYQLKVYSIAWTYKTTISQNKIFSEISFSSQINWWQGKLNINIALEFDNTDFDFWDVVKVYCYDDNHTTWKQIYLGFVNEINRIQSNNEIYIQISLIWMAWMLSNILFDSSWKVFTKTDEPATILQSIIDYFNTQVGGNWISYTTSWWTLIWSTATEVIGRWSWTEDYISTWDVSSWWSIDTYWTDVSLDFNYDSCWTAIKKVAEITNFRWYVDWTWMFYFKPKPTTITHSFTNQRNLDEIKWDEPRTSIINKLYLERDWGTIKTYEDITSQTTYWIMEKKESKTDLQNETSQDEFWNNYIDENKLAKKQIKLTINSNYDLETIQVWETIRVNNFVYNIAWLQIQSVDYKPYFCNVNLEKKIYFTEEIKN